MPDGHGHDDHHQREGDRRCPEKLCRLQLFVEKLRRTARWDKRVPVQGRRRTTWKVLKSNKLSLRTSFCAFWVNFSDRPHRALKNQCCEKGPAQNWLGSIQPITMAFDLEYLGGAKGLEPLLHLRLCALTCGDRRVATVVCTRFTWDSAEFVGGGQHSRGARKAGRFVCWRLDPPVEVHGYDNARSCRSTMAERFEPSSATEPQGESWR
jgi:hypothetical protein